MTETLTEFQQFLANHLGIDSVTRTDLFRHELEGYGIESVQDFEDSYFENRLDIEMFSKQYLRSTEVQETIALDLWNIELSIFLNKYDLWQNSPYIIEQHGNLRLHKRLYEEVEKLL